MSPRITLGPRTQGGHQPVDQLLDAEDSIVIVIGQKQVRTYVQGFGLSGCQLEMLSLRVERAVRALVSSELAEVGSDARQGSGDGRRRRRRAA